MEIEHIWIIIPTLNPNETFLHYVRELIQIGFRYILIVDDGSDEKFEKVFEEVAKLREVKVFSHYINLGKGRALKDAFNYFLTHSTKSCAGVITVDSDGQHAVEDVKKIGEELCQKRDGLLLGTRDFDEEDVPFKSRFGNKMTTKVMQLLLGKTLKDTQTGLRGIPREICVEYLQLFGERFEYEINMLIKTIEKEIPIYEIPIKTIYIDGNSETHFRPLKDSVLIYKQIFRSFLGYSIVSAISFFIDIVMFQVMLWITAAHMGTITGIWTATVGARIVSSLFNFFMNRNIVFGSKDEIKKSIIQYYMLCGGILVLSGSLVSIVVAIFRCNKVITKIVVDSILFLLSFQIQKRYIFKEK